MNNLKLIKKFKKDNNEAIIKLLDKYEGFIKNFASLLYYGDYNLNNTAIRNFLELLTSSDEKIQDVESTIKVINEKYSSYDYNDVYNDVRLAFIMAVKDFDIDKVNSNDINKPFEYYMSTNFCYILKRNTVDRMNDTPLYQEYVDYWATEMPQLIEVEDDIFNKGINKEWVDGLTCNEYFSELSCNDRLLLKKYYIDKMTLQELSKDLDKSPSTISRKLKQIENQLHKLIEDKKVDESIYEDYKNGKSIREISQEHEESFMTIYRRLNNHFTEG